VAKLVKHSGILSKQLLFVLLSYLLSSRLVFLPIDSAHSHVFLSVRNVVDGIYRRSVNCINAALGTVNGPR
jgi:hypothetical protein